MQGLQREGVIVRVDRVGIEADNKDGIANILKNLWQFMLYNLNIEADKNKARFLGNFPK